MKSSRLSAAGRLRAEACMLGSRRGDPGGTSCSSACPLWGREGEGRALLDPGCPCPLGPTSGSGQLGGSSRTREKGQCGHPPAGCPGRLPEAQWTAC